MRSTPLDLDPDSSWRPFGEPESHRVYSVAGYLLLAVAGHPEHLFSRYGVNSRLPAAVATIRLEVRESQLPAVVINGFLVPIEVDFSGLKVGGQKALFSLINQCNHGLL